MGTENALMAAALTPGSSVIRNAASEPHVQDLARMLNKMGAAIEGIGSNVMYVHGMGSSAAASTPSRPTTSRSPPSWRSRASPAASCGSATASPRTCG